MTREAFYLSRLLLDRMRTLELSFVGNPRHDEWAATWRRQQLVADVLFAEEGITDGPTAQLVLAAMPAIYASREATGCEKSEFAEFLDAQLSLAKR